ncbi:hypothetical protein MKX01_034475 [Papaver californicum]|nr:hypothetical protein MKX01_034475 [Papaver californicum]
MRTIKQLSKDVYSSLRSSVVLFDLTRIVEELIFNSIDANATKVNVGVSVGTCYVKVDDDGHGITRDGLVLVGEKYATSKLQYLAEMDAATDSFGFRGEALSSLSDISLLEIITKARGMPNGYRKIIKSCKCLYLGIDDDRRGYGTTVTVRDLFYNQPVRRKYMQSSFKKVLHSVKKCVLRIALVHPQISFKVNDVESGNEILYTTPSLSHIPLVSSGFGTDVSRSLCEVNFSNEVLNVSGYLSGPADTFSMKALQYFYINSRFICKSPIHKLLNNLAASMNSLDMWEDALESRNGKRCRIETYPAFILNLRCPRSSYDLTFEPSKTLVEFKDWIPILSFIEQGFRRFWRRIPPRGEIRNNEDEVAQNDEVREDETIQDLIIADKFTKSTFPAKKCKILLNQSCLHLSPFSTSPEIHSEDSDIFSNYKYERKRSRESRGNATNFKEHQMKAVHNHQSDITFHDMTPTSSNACISKCASMVSPEHCSFRQAAFNDSFASKDNYLFCDLKLRQDTGNMPNHDNLGARWGEEFLGIDADLAEVSMADQLTFDVAGYKNEIPFPSRCSKGLKKPFLRRCSSRGNVTPEKPLFETHQQSSIQIDELRTKGRPFPPDDRIGDIDTDEWCRNIDFLVNTSLKKSVVVSHRSSSSLLECSMTDTDILSMDFVKPYIYDTPRFVKERDLLNDSLVQVDRKGLGHLSTDSASCWEYPFSIFGTSPQKVECFTDKFAEERNFRSCRSASFTDGDDEFLAYNMMHNGFIDENYPATGCTEAKFDFEHFVSPKRNYSRDLYDRSLSKVAPFQNVGSSYRLVDGIDWQSFDTFNMDEINNCTGSMFPSHSPLHHKKGMNARGEFISQNTSRYSVCKGRSRRCSSASPFYKGRNKFSTMLSCMTTTATNTDAEEVQNPPVLPGPEISESKQPSQLSSGASHGNETKLVEDSPSNSRKYVEDPYNIQDVKGVEKNDCQTKSKLFQLYATDRVEELISYEMENSKFAGTKWRHDDPRASRGKIRDFQDGDESHSLSEGTDVLDVSSGILLLAGGSVVPDSISKECLDNAKVLMQLDKKFIPIIGGSILAVIDQHAADERIRLEELRQKVLRGEGKTVTYLDSEQELVLPEIGYQLLQNYAEQMQHWGWICNVDSQSSGSFTKKLKLLHRRQSAITLIAVPCILGVNLSDKDLLEFLEQLYDTDGSSTMPPSVLRVLNFKACRGAIMFGDALLPSECSLIVEELKQTSLCFQCAHGRPTTAPLVNLGALHRQITNLRSWSKNSDEVWHGLHRHRPSLERATERLSSMGA